MAFEFQPVSYLPTEDNQLLINVFNNDFPGVWGPPEPFREVIVPSPDPLSPSTTEGEHAEPTSLFTQAQAILHGASAEPAPLSAELYQHPAPGPTKEPHRARRESANVASRNYRQRKKQHMEEIVAKLNDLTLENERLRKENEEARNAAQQLLQENMSQKEAMANLHNENHNLRAGSAEAQVLEAQKLVDQHMEQMNQSIAQNAPDEVIRSHLANLQQQQRVVQDLKIREVQQLISPKVQAKLVILDKSPASTPKVSCCSTWARYLKEAGVSPQQIEALQQLKTNHFRQLEEIYAEREVLNREIKEFYIHNINACGEAPPVVNDNKTVIGLSQKLEQLRSNLNQEIKLQDLTFGGLSTVLSPTQAARLTLKQYEFQKAHSNSMEMLNNIWAAVSHY